MLNLTGLLLNLLALRKERQAIRFRKGFPSGGSLCAFCGCAVFPLQAVFFQLQ